MPAIACVFAKSVPRSHTSTLSSITLRQIVRDSRSASPAASVVGLGACEVVAHIRRRTAVAHVHRLDERQHARKLRLRRSRLHRNNHAEGIVLGRRLAHEILRALIVAQPDDDDLRDPGVVGRQRRHHHRHGPRDLPDALPEHLQRAVSTRSKSSASLVRCASTSRFSTDIELGDGSAPS